VDELDELEALIPTTTTSAAAAAAAEAAEEGDEDDDDGLAEAYRDIQAALGEGEGEGEGQEQEEMEEEEAPADALGPEALLERCQQRLRRIETALDDYEVRVCVFCLLGQALAPHHSKPPGLQHRFDG
jgi:arginyl-tRNA synthetase